MRYRPTRWPGGCGVLVLELERAADERFSGGFGGDGLCLPYGNIELEISAGAAFAAFADTPGVAFLDSGGPVTARSRFSYLAVDPFHVIRSADPWQELAEYLGRFRQVPSGPTPFTGGAAGFLSYELASTLDSVPGHPGAAGIPPCSIGFYDLVLAFDRQSGRAWLHSSGLPETVPAQRRARAADRAAAVLARLAQPSPRRPPDIGLAWRAETGRAQTGRSAHMARVAQAIAYIEAGDIYQANITAAFRADRPAGVASADIYRALRAQNPAPFAAYIAAGADCAVASLSPERFITLSAEGEIEARPIKGTSPRHADPVQDRALAAALLASAKDRAENLMIVDLLRNDIARVASAGSVHVPELAVLESFAHVHHLVSSVRGRLGPGATATNLLRATFPAGSITGAPKHRAQQIIHELEPSARGPYCGSVVWMGWDGAMDSSVAIRTATVTQESVTIQAGGGIVADSDPAAEYEELLVKIRPLLRALGPFAG